MGLKVVITIDKPRNQVQLTKEGYLEQPIKTLQIKGGLRNPERTQKVEISYYHGELGLKPKAVLSFGIFNTREEYYTEKPSSLRFESFWDIDELITILQELKVKLGKKQSLVRSETKDYYFDRDIKMIRNSYIERI